MPTETFVSPLAGRLAASLAAVRTIVAAAAVGLGLLAAGPANAQLQITVQGGNFQPMPIGVPDFDGDPAGNEISQIIVNNLRLSGYFAPLEKNANPQRVLGANQVPDFAVWTRAGAQAVVTGTILRQGGQIVAQVRLFDATGQKEEFGQQFATSAENTRRLAHIISDAIYSKLTGFGGFFDSRIVYVDESGPKDKRVKRLAVMDWDGANVRYLTRGEELVITPRFSPNGQTLAYMSFGRSEPRVFLLNVATGARQLLGQFAEMTFSPRFSPDGRTVVFSLQKDGDANIYAMGIGGGGARQLTSGAAIDTAPSYSPDGGQIVFESDRGGSQQIYVMSAGGGGANRISFGAGRYSTPVWSPDPQSPLIAFTKQEGGKFKIGVMRPDGSGERILSEGFHAEGPTWAPNGRYLMFFKDESGGPALWMVDVTGRVQQRIRTPGLGSDPAWSPLLGN